MKRGALISFCIIVFFSVLLIGIVLEYKYLLEKENNVLASWSDIEEVYHKQVDLISNLLDDAEKKPNIEKYTLEEFAITCKEANRINFAEHCDRTLANFQKTEAKINYRIPNFLKVIRKCTDSTNNQYVIDFQTKFNNYNDTLSLKCKNYNDIATDYNTARCQFPANIVAKIFSFDYRAELKDL